MMNQRRADLKNRMDLVIKDLDIIRNRSEIRYCNQLEII